MVLIVDSTAIARLLADHAAIRAGINRIQALAAAGAPCGQTPVHSYASLESGHRFSLLAHHVREGSSLRWFPADGTPEPTRDGSSWLLFDPDDGHLLALFGASLLSPLRTALPSVALSRKLAGDSVTKIGIIGTGRQAVAHLSLLQSAFPRLQQVRFWSPQSCSRTAFAEKAHEQLACETIAYESCNAVYAESEVIYLLGPPDQVQMHEAVLKSGTVVVALGNTVDPAFRAQMARISPFDMATAPSPEIAVRLLELGGLYPWDATVARWAFDECRRLGLGQDIPLC